ncbi:MAG: putative lipid II flippase FtsW [Planctomycetes bacterium]|nr:putative lipid II flippase FtsW [Planctomycetota bacterium]
MATIPVTFHRAPDAPLPPPGRSHGYAMAALFICGALMTVGAAMVYSASVSIRGAELSWYECWRTPLRQCLFAGAGFLAMLTAAHVDYRLFSWRRHGWLPRFVALLAAVLLVVAVLAPGVGSSRLGHQRSIAVFGAGALGFQPAEVAKLALIVWLAARLSRPRNGLQDFRRGFLPTAGCAGILIALTAIADFGTAALMGAVLVALLLLAGARWRHVGALLLAGAVAGAGFILTARYRIDRIVSFFSETPDPTGKGYQITQALIAIGSGGWWGRGLGAGVQKYGYLPQDNNDFILAIVCEEMGVAGGIAIVALFLALLWCGWRIAAGTRDPLGRLLAAGITLTICLQAAFNVGVVTNSIPTKGISLPFVSAGGSGVLFFGIAVGLLAAVGRARDSEPG